MSQVIDLELKQATGFYEYAIKGGVTEDGTFEGYASTFNNVDLQGDIVLPGAFSRTLKHSKGIVPILMAHMMGRPVGFGIEAAEDDKGLRIKGQFTMDNRDGKDAAASVGHSARLGHKFGLSIGYRVFKDGAEWDEERGIRKLKSIDLLEYSLAAVPANPQARVKSDMSIRDFEQFLRDSGFSQKQACTIASRGFAASQGDLGAIVATEEKRAAEAFMAELRRESFLFDLQKESSSYA